MTHLCDHGCGQLAHYYSQDTRKHRCSKSSSSCPAIKKQNSERLKEVHASREIGWNGTVKGEMRGWSKFTKSQQANIRASSSTKLKEHWANKAATYTERKKMLAYYRRQCAFTFGNNPEIIASIKGYELLKEHGMYHKHQNPNGVVKDHKISCHDGFDQQIDPELMRHPANCEFMLHKDNARKTRMSSITHNKLQALVLEWETGTFEGRVS
jgi:hypothetical protein